MQQLNCLLTGLIILISGISCTDSAREPMPISNPVQTNSELPYLFSDEDNLYMSWIHHAEDSDITALKYSKYDGNGWSEPKTIQKSDSWFVNWADFPSIMGRKGQAVAAHWLDKIPGNTYSYNVNISLADENGIWSEPITPHHDSTATEHGFVSMINWEDNRILAAWLDGRQTADRADDEYYDFEKAMTLRSGIISSGGEMVEKYLIDDSVCDCCQTTMANIPGGALVAYRDRTEEEVRDISVSRFINGNWSDPQTVYNDNWKISACPVNGPKLATGDSLTVLAWFTGADDTSRVKAAVSNDFGKTFSPPYVLNDNQTLGRVDAEVSGSDMYISWLEKEESQYFIKVKRINQDGNVSNAITVAAIDGSRRSGFPQMELFRDRLIFAWTDITTPSPTIKTAEIKLDANF